MTWIRLEDDHFNHPDIIGLPPQSSLLYVAGLCYSRHYLTDGFVSATALPKLATGVSERWVAALVPSLWEEVPGGWQIRNFERYQQTKDEVLRSREAGANRARRSRERKRDRAARPSTEVEEEIDNTPLPPSRGDDVVCIRCQGKGVYYPDHEAASVVECDCKWRKSG